jgi:uncharacterized membrane protein YgaE (UPF0421/DUF939 family)
VYAAKLAERPAVTLSKRARIALVIALVGVAISIVPTVLFLLVIENKRNDPLGWEIFADFPLHLLTAFIGAVIGFTGALLFRSAVRKELEVSRHEEKAESVLRRAV